MVIRGLSSLVEFVQDQPADLAILAVPASAAQSVLLQIEEAGIPGVLNFAPVAVQPSAGSRTIVQEVDLAIELQRLAFSVVR
jgi:redox-sensing transcriptional repressor